MRSGFKTLTGATAALALCLSPTMASAATSSAIQPINPLIAVSVYGTQASAQTVCANTASAAAAGAVAAAQAQQGCVLPAVDTPPPLPAAVAPAPQVGGLGISPVLLGLLGIAALAALIALSGDDDDDDTPESPS